MPRIVEEPVAKEDNSPLGGTEYSHPAYGQIRASRVSGHQNLYGSDFRHHGYITIVIARSKLRRSLSRDWEFAGQELIDVSLSEAQWATFVSSLNCGGGTPCTINHIDRVSMPDLPDPPSRKEQFDKELKETMARSAEVLGGLRQKILDMKISEKMKKELISSVDSAGRSIGSNVNFVANSFSEHMEEQVEKAKCEVNAYASGLIQRAGLEHLQNQAKLSVMETTALIENKEELTDKQLNDHWEYQGSD